MVLVTEMFPSWDGHLWPGAIKPSKMFFSCALKIHNAPSSNIVIFHELVSFPLSVCPSISPHKAPICLPSAQHLLLFVHCHRSQCLSHGHIKAFASDRAKMLWWRLIIWAVGEPHNHKTTLPDTVLSLLIITQMSIEHIRCSPVGLFPACCTPHQGLYSVRGWQQAGKEVWTM